ncbi:MAG: hypothetical protein KC546_06320, partial [Anaerolineae bacterium]|nr:hypothetical protein [Anaerolineae bacterium]
KVRIKALMREIEFTHLKKNWVEKLIAGGVEEDDVYKWVAEIGHVVDEYERNLRFLVDLMDKTDAAEASFALEGWRAYTMDMTVWKLDDSMQQLEGRFEKYLPPEEDYDDDTE